MYYYIMKILLDLSVNMKEKYENFNIILLRRELSKNLKIYKIIKAKRQNDKHNMHAVAKF